MDEKYVELDYELAVALANGTDGAARSTVTQAEPSRGLVAWQALADGYAPMSSSDSAVAVQPILATLKRCKEAKELNEGNVDSIVIEGGLSTSINSKRLMKHRRRL